MRALVVVESYFGNTHLVAQEVAAGLADRACQVELIAAADAPSAPDVDLVVVAAPTHNLGLPSVSSRGNAERDGGEGAAPGVAEWLGLATPKGRLVAIDTVVPGRFSGSAAKKATALAARRGWRAERGDSFIVTGKKGPLRDGELSKARQFGSGLA